MEGHTTDCMGYKDDLWFELTDTDWSEVEDSKERTDELYWRLVEHAMRVDE